MNIITISIDNYDEAQREQLSYIRGPIIVYNIASMIVNISLILGVRMVNIFNSVKECVILISNFIYSLFQGKPVLMFPSICMNFSAIIVLIAGAIAVFTIPSLSLGIAFGIFFTVLLALGKSRLIINSKKLT